LRTGRLAGVHRHYLTQLARFGSKNVWDYKEILVLIPSDEKMYYQDLLGRRFSIVSKNYGCWMNFMEDFFTGHGESTKIACKNQKI
jgi:hypothetical protein